MRFTTRNQDITKKLDEIILKIDGIKKEDNPDEPKTPEETRQKINEISKDVKTLLKHFS